MQPFVLSGPAHTVFDLIALKAKRQAELEAALKGHPCHISVTARCNMPSGWCSVCKLWAEHIEGRDL